MVPILCTGILPHVNKYAAESETTSGVVLCNIFVSFYMYASS